MLKTSLLSSLLSYPLMAPGDEGGGAGAGAGAGDQGAAGAGDGKGSGDGDKGGASPFAWAGETLDDDTKAYLTEKGYDTPDKAIKGLRGAEKLLGGKSIAPPPEDPAKVGEWLKESGVAKALGIPDDAKGYGVEKPTFAEEVAPFVNFDDDRQGRFLSKSHELGLSKAQVEGIRDFYASEMGLDVKDFADQATADQTEMQSALKKDWGNDFDQNVTAAMEVAAANGMTPEQVEALRVGKVAGSATLTRILHKLAQVEGNDGLKGGGNGGGGAMTKEDAAKALADFQAKNATALTKADHPEHDPAMREMKRLMKLAGRGSEAVRG